MVLDPVRVEPQLLGILTEPEEIATRSPAEDSEAKPHPLVALSDPGMHCVFHAQSVNHARSSGPPGGRRYTRTASGPHACTGRDLRQRPSAQQHYHVSRLSLGETQRIGAGA